MVIKKKSEIKNKIKLWNTPRISQHTWMVTNLATIDICQVKHHDESVYHQQVILDDTTFITYICPGHQVRESRGCGWHCPWLRSSRWRSSSRLCASTFSVFVSRTPDWSALSSSLHWWKSCGVGQLSGCASSKSTETGKLCHKFYRKRSARSPPSVEWCPSFDPVGGRARCHLAVRGSDTHDIVRDVEKFTLEVLPLWQFGKTREYQSWSSPVLFNVIEFALESADFRFQHDNVLGFFIEFFF